MSRYPLVCRRQGNAMKLLLLLLPVPLLLLLFRPPMLLLLALLPPNALLLLPLLCRTLLILNPPPVQLLRLLLLAANSQVQVFQPREPMAHCCFWTQPACTPCVPLQLHHSLYPQGVVRSAFEPRAEAPPMVRWQEGACSSDSSGGSDRTSEAPGQILPLAGCCC